eukprot:Nitzschia sp. Nitz4//scaffold389_size11954//9158//10153//NITZ4_009011-RA/size11954-augustus-gene-0.13-mRNA-1//-1//CDS//3329549996//5215//frame0
MSSDPSKQQAAAREEVVKCEQEIQSIKAALRKLGTAGNAEEPNSLDVSVVKVEGLPEGAKPTLKLQLSSPIEEKDLVPEGAAASFEGVDASVAMLTIVAKDADIPLGSSSPTELASLCALEPMSDKTEYVTELAVAILPEGEVAAEATDAEDKESETPAGEEATEAKPVEPTCTITVSVTFKPSAKDQREELYEMLNKTSQRKATALEELRSISVALARSGAAQSGVVSAPEKPAVKPGFLNKKKEPTQMERLYERTIGPNSILRKSFELAVVARNYLIFFGAITAFHFRGQMLALPPPV